MNGIIKNSERIAKRGRYFRTKTLEPLLVGAADEVDRSLLEVSPVEVTDDDCGGELDGVEEGIAVISTLETEEDLVLEAVGLGFEDIGESLAPKPAPSKPRFNVSTGWRPTNHVLVKIQDCVYVFQKDVS